VNFLLDTNVISEWAKPEPDRNLVTWLAEVDEGVRQRDFVRGDPSRNRADGRGTAARTSGVVASRRVAAAIRGPDPTVDPGVADSWGVVMARSEKKGHAMGSMDAFVAGTAEAYGLTLVTRNIRDFEHVGISLVDPWQPRP